MNLSDWMLMWFSKFLVNAGLVLALILALAFGMFLVHVPRWIRQKRCKHRSVMETLSCDAICNDCYKNLGFIGTWRKQNHPLKKDDP